MYVLIWSADDKRTEHLSGNGSLHACVSVLHWLVVQRTGFSLRDLSPKMRGVFAGTRLMVLCVRVEYAVECCKEMAVAEFG